MTADAVRALLTEAGAALGVDVARVTALGPSTLTSPYPVSALATASVGAAGAALADLLDALGRRADDVVVDRPAADAWFGAHVRPDGWEPPPAWDPVAGDYRTRDGWVRLHTNAPRHRAAALAVLGTPADRVDVAAAALRWSADELEAAVVEAGGAAAALRTADAWAHHPQGAAVAAEPFVGASAGQPFDGRTTWRPQPGRPLAGLRVLDLTRVLAGPTATQLLGGLGADVLRLDPPDWDEPGVLPFVMWSKRTARLDARTPDGAGRLRALLADADVLVHGYRAGVVDALGLADRDVQRPGLVDVAVRAYGWTGPWAGRRGFDSLVQLSSGIAATGVAPGARPVALPVQALDYATGYLAAAAALAGLARRVRDGVGSSWRLSLARTAVALEAARALPSEPAPVAVDVARVRRETPLGPVDLAAPPVRAGGVAPEHVHLGVPLGRDAPTWW